MRANARDLLETGKRQIYIFCPQPVKTGRGHLPARHLIYIYITLSGRQCAGKPTLPCGAIGLPHTRVRECPHSTTAG
nr:MAG TPA: hypothetical protein [Caudoviricetes sp.]